MLWTIKASKILKKYWNINNLKDKQFEVINQLLLGNDVIGLLPTGYGKSMCYIIPPLVTKKIIFIISPLLSLMEEQKNKLLNINIPCCALNSNNKNKNEDIQEIMNDNIKIVFMSPEYLMKTDAIELARTLIQYNKLGFFAIDESHCISSWGHDFRPEYRNICKLREYFPTIPILAVTATATQTVCNDIIKLLLLNNPIIVRASFDRPNLYIKINEIPTIPILKNKKIKENNIPIENIIIKYVNKYINDKIIIYINSREETEKVSDELNKINNGCCEAYHAGLSKKLRDDIHNRFINGNIKIIISTIAFGMGIDQIVRCVLIFGFPSSIEEYYQQIGRGGRDGLYCETVLYFDKNKFYKLFFMIKNKNIQKKNNLNNIKKLIDIETCRRKYILEYFNEKCNFNKCNNCDNCCKEILVNQEKLNKPDNLDIFDKYDKYSLLNTF